MDTNNNLTSDIDLSYQPSPTLDVDEIDTDDRIDTDGVDITRWDPPATSYDNSTDPIRLRPPTDQIDRITADVPDVIDDGQRGYSRTLLYVACIPDDTHPMWFGAILDWVFLRSRDHIEGYEDQLQQDIGGDEPSAAYWADPLAYWDAEEREARERARYLRRHYGDSITDAQALCAAHVEQGYTHGMGPLIDVSTGTAALYHDQIDQKFGKMYGWIPHDERFGPLDKTDETANQLPDSKTMTTAEVKDRDGRILPQDLLDVARWICWKREKREDKDGNPQNAKIPKAPWKYGDGDASATDPDNWVDYDTASDWAEKMPGPWGIGYAFAHVGPFVGLDFDGCRDPETGEIDDWVMDIVNRAVSFAQISTSGTGIHVFLRGKLTDVVKNEAEGIEIYDRQRFFAMTGNHLPGTPVAIPESRADDHQELIDELVDAYATDDTHVVGNNQDPLEVKRIYRNDGSDAWSPFDAIRVRDVYPDIPVGDRVGHPEHGSSTGKNFVISATNDGKTGTCWKGSHAFGEGDGCGLNAQQLLAMRAVKRLDPPEGSDDYDIATNCRAARQAYHDDDRLVYLAYKHAVLHEDHLDFDPNPPPYRAIRHMDQQAGFGELEKEGGNKRGSFKFGIRVIAHDMGIKLDTNPKTGRDRSSSNQDQDQDGDREGVAEADSQPISNS